jgi:hypothetical protein
MPASAHETDVPARPAAKTYVSRGPTMSSLTGVWARRGVTRPRSPALGSALRQQGEQHSAQVTVASHTEGFRDAALDVADDVDAGCHALPA